MAGKDQNKEDRPVSDWPNMDPRWWMLAAVTVFGFAIIGAAVAAVEVFSRVLPTEAEKLVTVLTPFGTIILAVVTFLTVVWRGLLTDQQVKEQRRQNNAKDDELLAKLLADGAALIENDSEAKRMAGVSVLDTVATTTKSLYAGAAMDILLDFWERHYRTDEVSRAIRNTYHSLFKAAAMGRRANTGIALNDDVWTPNTKPWRPPYGAWFVHMRGGYFDRASFADIDRQTLWSFLKVRFDQCTIERGNWAFTSCEFIGCAITDPPLSLFAASSFTVCDFSGASIDAKELREYVEEKGSLTAQRNYYYEDDPPIAQAPVNWPAVLLCLPPGMRPPPPTFTAG
ncbi:hypothetical protein NBH20_01550 [Rhizobium sp. S153]|uniref:Pentapeptide repeat protein n=1 Tax=Ciceribacter sichuanensis TaxID=2949647 RepID=A0ABT0V1Y1_9HYPH|nr:hypothetical protein [Ciceribacter sp. S153]MCM2399827.1 hypothetical protein [Ciceribacter sp. S153]